MSTSLSTPLEPSPKTEPTAPTFSHPSDTEETTESGKGTTTATARITTTYPTTPPISRIKGRDNYSIAAGKVTIHTKCDHVR